MKKILFFGAMVALLLGAASCSSDIEPAMGGEVPVSFSVNLGDGVDSRTISDGLKANQLKFAVFENGTEITALAQKVPVSNKTATVTTKLVKGHTYTFVFWAQDSTCTAYNTTDMSAITVDYNAPLCVCNDESRDAFYKMDSFKVTEPFEKEEVLTRPFAQINFLASDAAGVVNVDQYQSQVTVTGVPTTLNTLEGTVADPTEVTTYAYTTIPKETLEGYETYKYVAMNYVLAGTDKEMKTEVALTVKDEKGAEVNTVTVANCPVQRNYRTNIFGDLFTLQGKFNITIDPIYEGEFNLPEKVWDGTLKEPANITGDVIEINDGSELAWVMNNVTNGTSLAGKTFKLTDDINLGMLDWPLVNAKCAFTLDGNGKTIKGLKSTGGNYGGLIGRFSNQAQATLIKDLTIADSEIDASGRTGNENAAGAFIGWSDYGTTYITLENCVSKNVKLGRAQYNGGLVGYASNMVITNCVVLNDEIVSDYDESGDYKGHSGCVAGYGNQNATITNTSVTDSKITGRNDRGRVGIFYGTAQASVTIGTGNSVKNVTILGETATSAKLVGSVDNRSDKSNDASVVFE